jgi:hypothetical protein
MILNFISGSKSPIGKHTLTILLLLSQSRKSFRAPKCAKENCYVVRAKAAPPTKRYPDLPHANINNDVDRIAAVRKAVGRNIPIAVDAVRFIGSCSEGPVFAPCCRLEPLQHLTNWALSSPSWQSDK